MKKTKENKKIDIEKWIFRFVIGLGIFTVGVQIGIWQGRKLQKEENDIQINSLQSLQVVATAYSPDKGQCDNDPLITATNKKVKEGGIAVSRPLEKILPMGSWVFVEDKLYEVNDRMSPKWQDYRIDVFCWNKNKARAFGKKKVVIWY
ncbi:MAG: 3D domain-containing protein, partial [bacterium]